MLISISDIPRVDIDAMPRPRKDNGAEPKKRSRTGCWPCKARKVKCGEEKPVCANCSKTGEQCDYSIRLNWAGRSRKDRDGTPSEAGSVTFVSTPLSIDVHTLGHDSSLGHEHVFSAQHITTIPSRPPSSHPNELPTPEPTPGSEPGPLDPRLRLSQQTFDFKAPQYGVMPSSINESPMSTDRSPLTSAPFRDEFRWSPQHSAKRVKIEPSRSPLAAQASLCFTTNHYVHPIDTSTISEIPNQRAPDLRAPAVPSVAPNNTFNYSGSLAQHVVIHAEPPDLRRLSVKSLLSEPSDESERTAFSRLESGGYHTYGYDHGFPDLDIPHNDDLNVILPKSPDLRRASVAASEVGSGSGELDSKHIAFEPGGYYAQPVPIRIACDLEPLPKELLNNQMNLLYFHHFINHTGRILVPHDCPDNPLRSILPHMAVRDKHLLHLLLTFSASHRARLLDHAEPAGRIAEWMADVLPALRNAIAQPASPVAADPRDTSSLAPLATAIMLASLEIISPHTFTVPISWQSHLKVAREIIISKGGLDHLAHKANGARDKVIFFLSRWFAYLDVLGSLSGAQQGQPLYGAYLEDGGGLWLVNRDSEEIYQIDCFFGFSGRCISLLAQVAELAGRCDSERRCVSSQSDHTEWQPTPDTRVQAEDLRQRLLASAHMVYRSTCYHGIKEASITSQEDNHHSESEMDAIRATNEAFHWAGLINIARRVLGYSREHPEVQDNVQRVLRCLERVRRSSSAESCMLFPMFTAGCEALTEAERDMFRTRMREIAGWGMANFESARVLMEATWSTGKPWETMVNGEFLA